MEKWYCNNNGKVQGPYQKESLLVLFENLTLSRKTLIWKEGMDWTPAEQVQEIDLSSVPPPIPKHQTTISKNRPWIRYFARMTDYWIWAVLCGFFFAIIGWNVFARIGDLFAWMLLAALWIPVEGVFLSMFGKTPGKWFFSTKVFNRDGTKLSFASAIKRACKVYIGGIGFGFPLVSLVTMIMCHSALAKNGNTFYDAQDSLQVLHSKIRPLKIILFSVLVLFFGFLIVLGSME